MVQNKCSSKECSQEWKINEAEEIEKLNCPHCGKNDYVDYVIVDQRTKYQKNWG